jgi:phage shock protein E
MTIMKTKLLAVLLLVVGAAFALTGCSSVTNATTKATPKKSTETKVAAQYHKITPEEAKARMDKNPKVIILDVRTPDEYKDGHIDKAILVPNEIH